MKFVNLNDIKLRFNFFTFTQKNFSKFNFTSVFDIFFMETKYQIMSVYKEGNATFILEKYYQEKLTEKEINDIVAVEIRRHTAFLEQKMKEKKG